MGLFSFLRRKKESEKQEIKTANRVMFEQIHEVKDTHLTKLATNIINGDPLIINLESVPVDDANKAIAFLSGVIYAIEGEILTISEKIILFGNSNLYEDGSMQELLDEINK